MLNTINYSIHANPLKDDEGRTTFQVRHDILGTLNTQGLVDHLKRHHLLANIPVEAVLEVLREEIVEHLLSNVNLHFDGIGRFSLQLGTKKVKGEDGKLHTKKYLHPDDLTAREVTIDGITFVPDKEMLNSLKNVSRIFVRHKGSYRQKVGRSKLLTTLSNYCQEHGSFTRNDFQKMFSVSRYRAQQMLDELVNAPYPKYYRVKQGPSYVYRKTGD